MPAARSTSSLPSTHLPNRRPSRCETKRWMSGSMHRSERRTRLLLRQVLPETDRVRASPSNPPLPSSRSPTYASHPSCETRACPHAVEAASASLIRLTCFTLGTVPADTRPKRKAVTAPGALAEPAVVNSSRTGQRGPGPGCAAVPSPPLLLSRYSLPSACRHRVCLPTHFLSTSAPPTPQPALVARACARTSISRARTCPCTHIGRRGHTKTEPIERDRIEELLASRETLPPPGADEASWLRQIALKKVWQTESMKTLQARCHTLELELGLALAENSTKDAEIEQLRQQAPPSPLEPAESAACATCSLRC